MYLLKNAWKSLTRSVGRNILIGVIVLVISVSCCIGLSIRQAAEQAREQTLESLSVTAQISVDRQSMMQQSMMGEGGFDKSQMMSIPSLTLEEMQTYAKASTVKSFYYTATISLNGTDDVEAISNSTSTTDSSMIPGEGMQMPQMESGKGGGFAKGGMGVQGDFTIIGYSSDEAMTDFLAGTSTLTEGQMFEEGTEALDCIISDELATYNNLVVGDTMTVVNPNNEEESYTLSIVGIYNNSQSTATSSEVMQGFSSANDPANRIYMSYHAVELISEASSQTAVISTDETTGMETTTAIPSQVSGTYVFADVESYYAFEDEVRELGLADTYTVSSADLTSYEQSLLPLENLSQMAGYFLAVVFGIGAIILVVLNIFNVRERKYEIGVLTAIGMKKSKVAAQFLVESFVITIIALLIGAGIGAVSSVPVTNTLLASQIEAQSHQMMQAESSFGRPTGNKEMIGGKGQPMANIDYISSVTSATDFTVLMQLLGIGMILTLAASAVSIIFIMRYEPLKILSNRD